MGGELTRFVRNISRAFDSTMNRSSANKTILVAGHVCLDVIPDLTDAKPLGDLKPGSLSVIGSARTSTGGVVSNTGLALQILGQPVKLVAKLGQDEFGSLIRAKFESIKSGLADDFIVDASSNTSYSLVISPAGRDRHFLHHPGCNDTLLAEDIPDSAFDWASLMHFGYPPLLAAMVAEDGKELKSLLSRSRSAGLLNSLDMAGVDPDSAVGHLNWLAILENTVPLVDIFMPSLDEIAYMLGETVNTSIPQLDDLRRISQRLLDYGAGMVGLKLGDYGLYFRSSANIDKLKRLSILDQKPEDWLDLELTQPCYQVDVHGTTGAGDCTIAGFLAAMSRGMDPQACLKMANAVGACNVERRDALSGLRSWQETQTRIAEDWPISPKRIHGATE